MFPDSKTIKNQNCRKLKALHKKPSTDNIREKNCISIQDLSALDFFLSEMKQLNIQVILLCST